MPGKSFIMNLAKLLIAAAWADGELSNDEVNALKDLLFLVPEMTGQDWLELELYMDSPVTPQERDRLLRSVLDQVRSAKDKRLVVETLKKLIEVDGIVSEEEAAVGREQETAEYVDAEGPPGAKEEPLPQKEVALMRLGDGERRAERCVVVGGQQDREGQPTQHEEGHVVAGCADPQRIKPQPPHKWQ